MSKKGKGKQIVSVPEAPRDSTPNEPQFYGITLKNAQVRQVWAHLASLEIRPSRYSYDDATQPLGIHEDVWRLFDRIGWTWFMKGCWPTYRDLTLEFLSTLSVKKSKREPTTMTFQLGNKEHKLTIDDLNDIFHIPKGGLREGDKPLSPFWKEITKGNESFSPRRSKVAKVRNPVFRYIHRVIASSLFARNDNSGMRKSELFVLHCMMTSTNVDMGYFLVEQFAKQALTPSGVIRIGGLITPIAEHLGVQPRSSEVSGGIYINLPQLSTMRIIRSAAALDSHYLFINEDLPDFPLPNPALTTVFVEENWKMNTGAHVEASNALEAHVDEAEAMTCDNVESSSGPNRRRNRENVQEDQFASFGETLETIRIEQQAIRSEQQALQESVGSRLTALENDVRVVRNDTSLMRVDMAQILQMMRDFQAHPGAVHPPP